MLSAPGASPATRSVRSVCSTMCFIPQPFTSLRGPLHTQAPLRPVHRVRTLTPASALPLHSLPAVTSAAAAAATPQQLSQLLAACSGGGSGTALSTPLLQELPCPVLLALLPQAQLAVGDVGEGLETPVQLLYLLTLLGFLVVGAYLVVRQVLIRRELEEAAKVLGDRVRAGEASSEDYFELGVILLRKKLYTQATKNLEKAKKGWEGEPEELAQVHNALGYSYYNMEKLGDAVDEYRKAVGLQPGYVTAWNNLADAYEQQKKYQEAYDCYKEALTYDPANKVAAQRSSELKLKLDRLSLRR